MNEYNRRDEWIMRKVWSVVLATVMLLTIAACAYREEETPEMTPGVNEKGTLTEKEKLAQTEKETVGYGDPSEDSKTFLEKKRDNDPVFSWEESISDEEFDDWTRRIESTPEEDLVPGEKERYEQYALERARYVAATNNYPFYYYYLSGESEFDGSRIEGHRNAEEGAGLSGYVPDSFILNMRATTCCVLRFLDSEIETKAYEYENDTVREKDQKQGTPEEYELETLFFQVESVLWGKNPGDIISLIPRIITEETISDLKDETKAFVVFLWENDNYHILNGKQYREYDLRARGLFLLEGGKLLSYSNIADVVQFEGKTPEEMIREGERLAQKYPELIEMVFQ